MNHRHIAASALASVLALGLVSAAQAHEEEKGKEKCFGIAKAGQNDCANLAGTHSCAGQSKTDNDVGEWKYLAKGSCAKLGGKAAEQAKAMKKK